jgi:hypothetical protein
MNMFYKTVDLQTVQQMETMIFFELSMLQKK